MQQLVMSGMVVGPSGAAPLQGMPQPAPDSSLQQDAFLAASLAAQQMQRQHRLGGGNGGGGAVNPAPPGSSAAAAGSLPGGSGGTPLPPFSMASPSHDRLL